MYIGRLFILCGILNSVLKQGKEAGVKLRGIEFGNIVGASGVQGFFGEGYGFHKIYRLVFGKRFDFSGMGFVSKTATLHERKGNVKDGLLGMLWPQWIRVNFWKGQALNAMGLPNRGLRALLATGLWQARKEPFMISIASVAENPKKRLDEIRAMVNALAICKETFAAPFALQINLSCPNTGHDLKELIKESSEQLTIAGQLGVALVPKYSIASAPIEAVLELEQHPYFDALCVSNTLPFGWEGLDWQKVWGTKTSPLAKLGGGGYSGRELRPLVCEYIARLRDAGFTKPINGGGGILCPDDVTRYRDAGASSCFLGSGAMLRPWRVKGIIERANSLEWR